MATAIHKVRRGTGLPMNNFDSQRPATLESFSCHDEQSDRTARDRLAGRDDLVTLGKPAGLRFPDRIARKPRRLRLGPISGRGRSLWLGRSVCSP